MGTYVGKLLSNTYDYDETEGTLQNNSAQTFLITLKTIAEHTKSLVSTFQTSESNQVQKGIIYLVVSHVLLLMLFISVFRTIFTPPGRVPNEWNLQAEDDLSIAIDRERNLLRNKLKKKQDDSILKDYAARLNIEGSIKERPSIANLMSEEGNVSQGSQGEEGREEDARLKDPTVIEQLNQIAFYNAMKKENRRFCSHCQMFKPDRTHHCRQCNRCVLKMDHHCPWVSNCIGFNNYKFFVNMVFYGVCILWFLVATYTEVVVDTIFNAELDSGYLLLIFFSYILEIMLGVVVTGFFCFHMWLILNGKSTLEFVEEKKSGDYNRGIWQNLKFALGNNFLLWFIPIAPNYGSQNGLDFSAVSKTAK